MRKSFVTALILIFALLTLSACGAQSQNANNEGVDFGQLNKTGTVELKYATEFSIDLYEDNIALVTINNEGKFLVVPETVQTVINVPEDVSVLKQPLDNSYMVSTSAMDMICKLDALDYFTLIGTKQSGWYLDDVVAAMDNNKLLFAGKYSQPDYELIVSKNCKLAIENTMISHSPQVKEKLEKIGVPVLVERSSYENHPLGRLEWIKLYGILYDKYDKAEDFYNTQLVKIMPVIEENEQKGLTDDNEDVKTIAFFYVTSNNAINVRKSNDYICKMIKLAGGKYVLDEKYEKEENSLSTMNMQMEDFYSLACNADIIIYNSTIDGGLDNIDGLIAKDKLFADFKAVKNNEVYCTESNFFQETTKACEFISDVNKIVNGSEDEKLTFIRKLEK